MRINFLPILEKYPRIESLTDEQLDDLSTLIIELFTALSPFVKYLENEEKEKE